jgi:hypothetical protein
MTHVRGTNAQSFGDEAVSRPRRLDSLLLLLLVADSGSAAGPVA